MLKISRRIEKVCQKLNINYISPYHDDIKEYKQDAEKLAGVWHKLKEIESFLYEIQEKYPKLKTAINIDLSKLNEIDQDIIIEARKIMTRKF